MYTIAFHSFKGGVGRTSAALNFAKATANSGKKVVLLELDVDAPGIRHKPGLFSSHADEQGYVDYLAHFHDTDSLQDNVRGLSTPQDEQSILDKIKFLRNIGHTADATVHPENKNGELRVISSGSGNDRYWWNLNSTWFNDFFSVSRNEYSEAGLFQLHPNKDIFVHEKRLLERLFSSGAEIKRMESLLRAPQEHGVLEQLQASTDILVIDCKSAREYACVPLYYWCDVAVLMFPFNYEGAVNAKRMYAAVRSAAKSVRGNFDSVKALPVVCRTPPNFFDDGNEVFSVGHALKKLNLAGDTAATTERLHKDLMRLLDFDDAEEGKEALSGFFEEKAYSIQEVSKGTIDEALLLNVSLANFGLHSNNRRWYSSILDDHGKLFEGIAQSLDCLFPDKKSGLEGTDWVALLTPPEISEVLTDEVFQKDSNKKIRNADQQINVLLREKSMQLLMASLTEAVNIIAKSVIPDNRDGNSPDLMPAEAALDSFRSSGRNIGKNFAEGSFDPNVSEDEKTYVAAFSEACRYDSDNAGFGIIEVQPDEQETTVDTITWHNCFFVDHDPDKLKEGYGAPSILQSSLKFLEGYLEGNLQVMCDAKTGKGKHEIKIQSVDIAALSEETKFDLQRNIRLPENRITFNVETRSIDVS